MPALAASATMIVLARPVLDVTHAASRRTIGNRVRANDHCVARLPRIGCRITGATIDFGHLIVQCLVVRAVPRLVEAVLGVQVFFVQEGQDQHSPTVLGLAVFVRNEGRRETAMLLMVSVHRQADLFQVLDAFSASRPLGPPVLTAATGRSQCRTARHDRGRYINSTKAGQPGSTFCVSTVYHRPTEWSNPCHNERRGKSDRHVHRPHPSSCRNADTSIAWALLRPWGEKAARNDFLF